MILLRKPYEEYWRPFVDCGCCCDHRTPWLAKVTNGLLPLGVASLGIPDALAAPGNLGYWRLG